MKSLISLLFVGSLSEQSERTWADALKLFVPFLFVFLTINYQYLPLMTTPLAADSHGLLSLNVAHQNAYCGKVSHTVKVFTPETPLNAPINKLGIVDESQRPAQCAGAKFLVLNEMSLSYLYAGIFKLYPSVTLSQINILFNFLKISTIMFFALVLFRLGLSPLYILLISIFSHFMIYCVDETHRFSIYPFFTPNYLFFLTLSVLYLYGIKKYQHKIIPFGIFIGGYAAFYCNFRSSYAVIALYLIAMLLIFIYLLVKNVQCSKLKAFWCTFLSLATFFIGFQLYTYTFIKPVHEEAKKYPIGNYTYHAIAHPLVLSLGITPSDLTTREGIGWNDLIGEGLAQRIDSSVSYLSKDYEKALFVYYLKLWLYYSGEMLEIYKNKFQNFTTLDIQPIVKNMNRTTLNGNILDLISWIQSHAKAYWKVWMILLSSLGMLGMFHRQFSFMGLFLSFSTVGSCLLLLCESTIIMHVFVMPYHSLVNSLYIMILLYYVQIVINALYRSFFKSQRSEELEYAR